MQWCWQFRTTWTRDLAQAVEEAITALRLCPFYVDKWVSFFKEIVVVVARITDVLETVHRDNICCLRVRVCEVEIPHFIKIYYSINTRSCCRHIVIGGWYFRCGSWCRCKSSTYNIYIIAPSPCHNSSHYTIQACEPRYENHLLLLSLSLDSTNPSQL